MLCVYWHLQDTVRTDGPGLIVHHQVSERKASIPSAPPTPLDHLDEATRGAPSPVSRAQAPNIAPN